MSDSKLEGLNKSQEALLEIEKACRISLFERSVYDPDRDPTEASTPDTKYYEEFIEGLTDKMNEFIDLSVQQSSALETLENDRDSWREKAIKLQ